MRVLVTGAAGFVAGHVLRALARRDIVGPSGRAEPIDEIVLADVVAPRVPTGVGWRNLRVETGDFADPGFVARLTAGGFDSIFHLAAALTIDAETDFRRGLEVNVLYTVDDPKKRAVGFKLSEGMDVPAELEEKFKFARQKSKLAGTIRGSFFVIKGEY